MNFPFFTMQKYTDKKKENPEQLNIFPDFPVFFRSKRINY